MVTILTGTGAWSTCARLPVVDAAAATLRTKPQLGEGSTAKPDSPRHHYSQETGTDFISQKGRVELLRLRA